MALSDMEVFNSFLYTTVTEIVAQQVELFNEASAGTIVLRAGENVGDYADDVFYSAFATPARRRNAYGSGAVAAQDLSQASMTSVKVAGAHGPFAFEPQQLSYIQRSPEEAALAIGEQVAAARLQDYLNTAVGAARAAIANAGLAYDGTAGTTDLSSLNEAAKQFGDRSSRLAGWVMTGGAYHNLIGDAITNANRLYEFGTINVVTDGLGRPLIVSDIPELSRTGTPDEFQSMGLVPGGIIVEDNGDFFANFQTNNGSENIDRTWQAEYTFNVGLKGFAWDKTNGGQSPDDTTLFTGSNWDKVVTDDKDLAGVIARNAQ